MKNTSLVLLTICVSSTIFPGISVTALAGNESETNKKAEQHFVKANELRKVADHDGAIVEYEKVISLSPDSKVAQNAQYWIGQSHFQAGRLDASLAAFQTLLDEHPASAIAPSTKQMIERVEQSKKEKTLVEAIKNGDLEQLKSLISSGVDVNTKVKAEVSTFDGHATYVKEGWTLLNLAIRHLHADVATFLINKGADVNGRDGFGLHKTPLHWVAHFGTAALAELLIAKGADVNAREDGGYTPLHNVTSDANPDPNDDLEIAKILISNGADIDAEDDYHDRPLHWAVYDGQLALVKLFISNGADIEAENHSHNRPLHLAARRGQLDIAKLLISKGADIEAENDYHDRPLHLAAQEGFLEVAKLLLKAGAYMDDRDKTDHTPLHKAVMRGHQDMVELLLDNGAFWPLRWHGVGLIGLAMSKNQGEMVKFLINKGLPNSPVHVAAFFGDIDEVKSYLDGGGDINEYSPNGFMLLLCAIDGGRTEVAELLIKKGANTNQICLEGGTALGYAAWKGRTEIVRMLLDNGAEPTNRALHAAVSSGRKDILEMLIAKGADVNGTEFKDELSFRRPQPPDYKFDMGWTNLHWACYCTNPPRRKNIEVYQAIVEVLVAHGADVNAKTKNGRTPMSLLKTSQDHSHNEKLIELLRKHGAKE